MDTTDIGASILAGLGVGFVVLLILAVALLPISWIVLIAWNLIASIFGWVTISFVQAIGVTLGLWVLGGVFKSPINIKND